MIVFVINSDINDVKCSVKHFNVVCRYKNFMYGIEKRNRCFVTYNSNTCTKI